MDIKAAEFGASVAIYELTESGQIGGTSVKSEAILPLTSTTEEDFNDQAGDNGYIALPYFELKVGQTYQITIDGNKYNSTAVDLGVAIVCGNASIIYADSVPNTGENWVAASFVDYGFGAMGFTPADEMHKPHTISVSIVNETIKPIDPKFLGGVCLPYIELHPVAGEWGLELPIDESNKLTEYALKGTPIIASTNSGSVTTVVLQLNSEVDGVYAYTTTVSLNGVLVTIKYDADIGVSPVWYVTLQAYTLTPAE